MEEDSYLNFMKSIEESQDKWVHADVKKDKRGEEFTLWERIGGDIKTAFPIMKCEGILQCSAKQVYEFMLTTDLKIRRKWDASLLKFEIVKTISPTNHVVHFVYKTPFPVKSRDFCMQRILKEDFSPTDGKVRYAILGASVVDDIIPQSSKYIRGEILIGGFLLEEQTENVCKITSVNYIDPKGWIPKFVINLTKNRSLQTLLKFSEIISAQCEI